MSCPKELEAELLAKYAKADKSPQIRPAARNADEARALLEGKPMPKAAVVSSKRAFTEKLVSIKELAKRKGVDPQRVRKTAREHGCYTKGSGLVPAWLAAHVKKPDDARKVSLTDEQIETLRLVYADGFQRRRTKPKKLQLQYWAKEWGIDRSTLYRHAKQLGLTGAEKRIAWTDEEFAALKRLAPQAQSAKHLCSLMAAEGFERGRHSLYSKLYAMGIRIHGDKEGAVA